MTVLANEIMKKKTKNTYVKQKKRVVDPTRKVVAADTGTYRLGRKGWGGAETVPPTPPPTTELLNPGIREINRQRQKRGGRQEGGRCLQTKNGSFQVKNEYMTFDEDKGA